MNSPDNPVRNAVIDIGTNSVKLLVADVAGQCATPVLEDSEQTRLGAGFFETRLLQAAAVESTAAAAARFAAQSRSSGAQKIRVIATSAARDARNPETLTAAVEAASGLRLEIISGDQEARWAFQGVASDSRFAMAPLLLLDVGGGSTEFILGARGEMLFRQSRPIGTVRMLETMRPPDPPSRKDLETARQWVAGFLQNDQGLAADLPGTLATLRQGSSEAGEPPPVLIGTGGTSTLLAKMRLRLEGYEREAIESAVISRGELEAWVEKLWSLPLEARRKIPGLPANRADVILTGAVIFESVLRFYGFAALHISTRGLRHGALMDPV